LELIRLPPGFRISVFARVENPRSLALGPRGTVVVGTRSRGAVWAVLDEDADGVAELVLPVAEGLRMPNGVAFGGDDLYVAEVSRLLRFDDLERHLHDPPLPTVIRDDLPTDSNHGWKYLRVGPDERLYVPIGAPCNVCLEDDPRYATIVSLAMDGSDLKIYAKGVRNTVGFDWHPLTGELWFSDNGRDWLGDDSPPDELNHAPRPGMHFGFPYCHGSDISDPEHGRLRPCNELEPPALELGAHVAALGARFYTGRQLPATYQNQLLIAQHGSWNRSSKVGYRVVLVRFEKGLPTQVDVLAEGWLQGEEAWGRPVDILQLKDGSLLISDDHADAIYRITYDSQQQRDAW
jgi:glucose/arabinose dehydrogenase